MQLKSSNHLPEIIYYDSYNYLTEDVNNSMLNIKVIDQICSVKLLSVAYIY